MNSKRDAEESGGESSAFEQRIREYATCVNEGRDAEAMEHAMESFLIAMDEAMANPSEDIIWQTRAADCEQAGDLAGAEEAYLKAISLARSHSGPGYVVQPLLALAGLYEVLGRVDEARQLVGEALRHAQESGIEMLGLFVLLVKCRLGLTVAEARDVDALAARFAGAMSNERMFALGRAQLLLVQARCRLVLGAFDEAERCLAESRLQARSGLQFKPRPLQTSVSELTASLQAVRGETTEAVATFADVVNHRRDDNELPTIRTRYRLAKSLGTYAEYLEADGRGAEAARVRAEARELTM